MDNPVTLDVGSGFETYLSSDGSTNQSVEVNTAGNYSVAVTDTHGCSVFDEIRITLDDCTLGVGNMSKSLEFYPNPAREFIMVKSLINLSGINVNIVGLLGNLVYSQS